MTPDAHYTLRAAFQVIRDMGLPLDVAVEFRERLEGQIAKWRREDAQAEPEVAA